MNKLQENFIDSILLEIKRIKEQTYLLDSITGRAFEINEISESIIKMLLDNTCKENVMSALKEEYEISSEQEKEIEDYISLLTDQQLINRSYEQLKKSIPPIRNITLAITSKCNLRCRHCLAGSSLSCADELELDLLQELSRQIKKLKVQSLSLFGGEPLMHKDFFQIAGLFKGSGQLKLNTNASLIDEKTASRIREIAFSSITVSLDGALKTTHEQIRGEKSYLPTIEGINNLTKAGNHVIISVTVHNMNFREVQLLVEKAKSLKVAGIRFNEVHFGGFAACQAKDLSLSAENKIQLLSTIEKLQSEYTDFISGSLPDLATLKKNDQRDDSFPLVVPPCGAGMGSLCIKPNGLVTPCEILWDEEVGNVRESSLEEIYYLSPLINNFRKPKIIAAEDVKECVGCDNVATCFLGHRCAPFHYPGETLQEKVLLNCCRSDY